MRLHYIAFGSNLSSRRLLQRLPGAGFRRRATRAGHRLHRSKRATTAIDDHDSERHRRQLSSYRDGR